MTNSLADISSAALKRAVGIKERVEALQNELAALLGINGTFSTPTSRSSGRVLSAAAKGRIAAAQRRRWAGHKARAKVSAPAGKNRRRVSPATRAKLTAIAKRRWAKVKAAGKTSL